MTLMYFGSLPSAHLVVVLKRLFLTGSKDVCYVIFYSTLAISVSVNELLDDPHAFVQFLEEGAIA